MEEGKKELWREALAILDDNLGIEEGIISNRFVTAKRIVEFAEKQVKKDLMAGVVECACNKRTPHEKRSEVLSNPLWEYEAGLYKHFKWGWKTLDEAYQIVTS